MTTNIYILKLEKGFYYVGKSDNVEKRYKQHLTGYGSSITKKYKPIQIEKIFENSSPFDEDKFVKEYMDKYGIDKVRGGTYINEILTDNQISNLKKELWGAKDLCTKCDRNTHWIKDCYATKDIYNHDVVDEEINIYIFVKNAIKNLI